MIIMQYIGENKLTVKNGDYKFILSINTRADKDHFPSGISADFGNLNKNFEIEAGWFGMSDLKDWKFIKKT